MPQIIRETSPWGNISKEFGTGLGEGLQRLAEDKLSAMTFEKSRKSKIPGLKALKYSDEEAESLSHLDNDILKEIIKEKLKEPGQKAYAQVLGNVLGYGEPGVPSGVQNQIGFPLIQEGIPAGIANQLESRNQITGLNEKQATKLAELGIQKQQYTEKQKAAAFKETKEDRKQILDKAKAAKENNARLGRIKEIDKGDNVQNPLVYSLLKKVGLDIPGLRSADSQELEKISNDFIKNAKEVFGSRITDQDLKAFMNTVPTLANTKEGRARIIRNLELMNKGPELEKQAFYDILKQNGNVPPLDLNEQIEQRISPQLDQIAEEFKLGAQGTSPLNVGSKLSSLPEPSSVPVGTQIKKKDGTILENTGSSWEKVK